MRIEIDNVVIRSAIMEDAVQLKTWWNDGEVMEHAGFPHGVGVTLEEVEANIKSREGKLSQLCMIEIDCLPVGECNYSIPGDGSAGTGWKITDPAYQNKGYGSKVILALLEFLFTDIAINTLKPIERVEWDTALENQRAQHVYEHKIGARKARVLESAWKDQLGNWRSSAEYSISKEEFFASR